MSLRRTIAIVTSRLPRLVQPETSWLLGLRASARRVAERGDTLLIGDSTAGCDFIARMAQRVALESEVVTPNEDLPSDSTNSLPMADRLIVERADAIVALQVRNGGNLHQLLRGRLGKQRPVELVDLNGLQPVGVRHELISLGATLWSPDSTQTSPLPSNSVVIASPRLDVPHTGSNGIYEIVPFPSRLEWLFLSHTTRACPGPWPDQSSDDYIDSLLEYRSDADHSPVAALARIVRQRRLMASKRTIRGGHSMVCFTAAPLSDLPTLRQFRTHRARWDFEPFGICIRRDWLVHAGARPVIYGDNAVWSELSPSDQPFFQHAQSNQATGTTIDWTVEREWRIAGDLDLSDLAASDALIFVPDFVSARRLAEVSPWPITLWPNPAVSLSNPSVQPNS